MAIAPGQHPMGCPPMISPLDASICMARPTRAPELTVVSQTEDPLGSAANWPRPSSILTFITTFPVAALTRQTSDPAVIQIESPVTTTDDVG